MNASDPQALLRVGNREPHGGQSDMFTQVLNSEEMVDQACRKRALIAAGCPLEIPLNHHHFVEFNLDADPAMAAVCRSQDWTGKVPCLGLLGDPGPVSAIQSWAAGRGTTRTVSTVDRSVQLCKRLGHR